MSTTEAQHKRFKGIDEEWRNDAMSRKDPEELNKLIRECAVNLVELRLAKEEDEDLAAAKEQVKVCNQVYKEGEKENSLRIEFLVECLKTMGIKVAGFSKKDVMAAAREGITGSIKEEETGPTVEVHFSGGMIEALKEGITRSKRSPKTDNDDESWADDPKP